MNNFLKTGIYTEGCIIPVTTEDPSLKAVLNEYSEDLQIILFVGNRCVGTINMDNFREIDSDLLKLPLEDFAGNYLKTNVWSEIRQQYLFDKAKIHGANSLHLVKDVYSLKKLDWYFSMLN